MDFERPGSERGITFCQDTGAVFFTTQDHIVVRRVTATRAANGTRLSMSMAWCCWWTPRGPRAEPLRAAKGAGGESSPVVV